MPEEKVEQAPIKRPPTYFQLSMKPGASVKTTTPLGAEELRKLIWEDGGAGRTGVVKIPVVPNPGNKSETFYCLRADIISILIVEPLAEEEKGKIVIPDMVIPKDILETKK